jgi:hypothetical protein
MNTPLTNTHLSDGDLVRLLDGEADAPEREHADQHLAKCAECRQRLQTLQHRSARLSEVLASSDWKAPPAPTVPDELELRRARKRRMDAVRPTRSWLRAAAVILVLLGAGVVASPARAWVTDWVGARWAELAAVWEPELSPDAGTGPQQKAGTRVQFTPEGSEFSLEFVTAQAGGAVIIRQKEVPFAAAEIVRGSAPTDLLVLPAGLRVQNTPESTAEYRIVVPAHTREVRIRIGDGAPRVFTAAEIAAGARLDLREAGR